MSDAPFVFVLSWERPVYLWVCLDSLWRRTTTPCRIVLVDNGSQHPMVREVISGFERRGLFHAVHLMDTNEPDNLHRVMAQYLPQAGECLAYVESDISIEAPTDACWLQTMIDVADSGRRYAMLGSYCDSRDFPDLERTRRLFPDLDDTAYRALVKADSPERALPAEPPADPVISPFNPPGRLLLLETESVRRFGFRIDSEMHLALRGAGRDTGISTAVRHRHLSLLHAFDEPGYDTAARAEFFTRFGTASPPPTRRPWWRLRR